MSVTRYTYVGPSLHFQMRKASPAAGPACGYCHRGPMTQGAAYCHLCGKSLPSSSFDLPVDRFETWEDVAGWAFSLHGGFRPLYAVPLEAGPGVEVVISNVKVPTIERALTLRQGDFHLTVSPDEVKEEIHRFLTFHEDNIKQVMPYIDYVRYEWGVYSWER